MDASTPSSSSATLDPKTLGRYADLIVGFGANVQPGQIVEVRADIVNARLVRAVAASAYRAGARFVDVDYFDPYVRRARIEHADEGSLPFVPSWHRDRIRQLGEYRCARIGLTPVNPPALYDDLAPARLALDRFPFLPEYLELVSARTTNWTAVACPTPAWAALVHAGVDADTAVERLWEQVAYMCRLDEGDPAAAWRARFTELEAVARRLDALHLDSLEFRGPGTELTIGLLPTSTWRAGTDETIDGIRHAPNLPSEETFTAPDPERVDGVVRATRPLQLRGGALVEGLAVRFERGRAVEIAAGRGGEALRELISRDDGAARVGEVALVDGKGRVGTLATVFYNTLLDENAASHVALGNAYPQSVGDEDRGRANTSSIHVDFMIGGGDVAVTGVTSAGDRIPLLREGAWAI